MRVLAIDTALEACSAAILDTERGDVVASQSIPMTRGHAEALMPLIDTVMREGALDFAQIDRIAVTTGPGSFTGLRVGIAAARGFALAANKPVVGLSTLAAFAAPCVAENDALPVVAAVDARHEHVYVQVYGTGGATLMAPRLASLRETVLRAAASGAPRLVGNAAELLAAAWPPNERPPATVMASRAPGIDWVARLGVVADPSKAPAKPLYLRAPDARPQDASRLSRQ